LAEGGGKESDAIEGMEIATRSKGESCPLCESATFISTFKSQNSAKMSAKLVIHICCYFVVGLNFFSVWFSLCAVLTLHSCQ